MILILFSSSVDVVFLVCFSVTWQWCNIIVGYGAIPESELILGVVLCIIVRDVRIFCV